MQNGYVAIRKLDRINSSYKHALTPMATSKGAWE